MPRSRPTILNSSGARPTTPQLLRICGPIILYSASESSRAVASWWGPCGTLLSGYMNCTVNWWVTRTSFASCPSFGVTIPRSPESMGTHPEWNVRSFPLRSFQETLTALEGSTKGMGRDSKVDSLRWVQPGQRGHDDHLSDEHRSGRHDRLQQRGQRDVDRRHEERNKPPRPHVHLHERHERQAAAPDGRQRRERYNHVLLLRPARSPDRCEHGHREYIAELWLRPRQQPDDGKPWGHDNDTRVQRRRPALLGLHWHLVEYMLVSAYGLDDLRLRRGREPEFVVGRGVVELQPAQPDVEHDSCRWLGTVHGLRRCRFDAAHLGRIDDAHEQLFRRREFDDEWNVYLLHS